MDCLHILTQLLYATNSPRNGGKLMEFVTCRYTSGIVGLLYGEALRAKETQVCIENNETCTKHDET